jgi:hypothetical protein
MLVVTTAGVMSTRTEEESILYQLYQYGLRVIRGEASTQNMGDRKLLCQLMPGRALFM